MFSGIAKHEGGNLDIFFFFFFFTKLLIFSTVSL